MTEEKKRPSADQKKLIEEEEAILVTVQEAIRAAHQKRRLNLYKVGERLKDLRDEAARAKSADLPALFDQMNTQRALIERTPDEELPDLRSPYFARMELVEKGRTKNVLLGHRTFLRRQ